MKRAIKEYNMINDGDKIAVGISGGKDSLVLLAGLKLLQRFIGISYELEAITIDPMFNSIPGNYEPVEKFCKEYDINYTVLKTHIGEIVFDIRKEPNPCSLCSRMRRGALHNTAKELGCNKLALGHNQDDAVETFFMNLFNEGRIDCFSPVSYLSEKNITVIRLVAGTAKKLNFPVVKSLCPADGKTNRETMRKFIIEQRKTDRSFSDKIIGALERADISGWGK